MTVLLLNGPPKVGKDEVAKYLAGKYQTFHHEAYARNLKTLTHNFIGRPDLNKLSWEQLDQLKDRPVQVKWQPLFAEQKTLRQWYIHVSENIMKPQFGNQVFGVWLANDILEKHANNHWRHTFAISDSGFREEYEALRNVLGREHKYVLIRLYRDGKTFEGDSRSYWEPDKLDGSLAVWDLYNNGTLGDLHRKLDDIFRRVQSYA